METKKITGQDSALQLCYAAANEGPEDYMADEPKSDRVTLEELMVSTLAMTDAAVKLLIQKGLITDAEFKAQLSRERANYLAVLKRMH
jgi:hypothetical protein